MAPTTRSGPNDPVNDTNQTNITPESHPSNVTKLFCETPPMEMECTGTEGVVGFYRWIEKIGGQFSISEIRSLGPEAYAMTWEKVDKYISGLPDNIYGNVKSARPKTLDETIELANDLMDQKLRTYAERQSDNKRKADDSSRNNHGHQQQPFKRQNVTKVYNMGTGERKPYGGIYSKNTGNTNVANTQKGNGAAPKGNGCFECGAPGHFKRDCPKLKNKDGGNGNAQGWVYAVGNAEKRGNAPGNPDANVVTGEFHNEASSGWRIDELLDLRLERIFKKRSKKKAKNKQFQARSRKGQSQKSDKARKYNLRGQNCQNLKMYCKRERQGLKLQRR
ncbi:reverse transcriptase domain-containing protein [Tanacetum coccineum]